MSIDVKMQEKAFVSVMPSKYIILKDIICKGKVIPLQARFSPEGG